MKFLSDAEFKAAIDKAVSEAGIAHAAALTAAQTKLTEMEASHVAAVEKLNADHKAALDKLSADHQAAMDKAAADHKLELEKKGAEVKAVAGRMASDIAKTVGLDQPIPESTTAATATDIAGLREQLAKETDPTKKANLSREIRKLTDAAKSKK